MNPSLLFGGGNALYTVHAALILQLRKNSVALDDGDDSLQAAGRRLRGREYLDLPTLRFRIPRVHPEDLGHEQRSFVSSSPGPDFEDNIFLVIRILGKEQHLQFFFEGNDPGFEVVEFFLSVGALFRSFSLGRIPLLCALAVFWSFAESLTISGDARALVNSS